MKKSMKNYLEDENVIAGDREVRKIRLCIQPTIFGTEVRTVPSLKQIREQPYKAIVLHLRIENGSVSIISRFVFRQLI